MKVLLSAYSCMPNTGTEPGNGWGTATQLAARGIEVHVLTRLENRERLEAHVREYPVPGLHFCYVDYRWKWLRNEGLRYLVWQFSAIRVARQLHASQRFDLVHHVTFGSVHVPTQLWRLGVPTVFGPVGGGQTAPESMLAYFGPRWGASRLREQARTLLTRLLHYSPLHRYWFSKMAVILVSNRETAGLVRALGREDVRMMFDTLIPESFVAAGPRRFEDDPRPLRLLWVGRMLPRKALRLSLDILSRVTVPVTMTMIGNGADAGEVHRLIAERGLEGRIFWQDRRLPLEEVRRACLEHDALLFNSLRESGGAQLLEAMATGLPVVTLNMQGPRDLVPGGAGLKVDVHHPEQVIQDAAMAIELFASLSGAQRSKMSAAAIEFSRTLTYGERAKQYEALYSELLANRVAMGRSVGGKLRA